MSSPTDRKYAKTHEWHRFENGVVTLGITEFAATELTDITYVGLPQMDREVKAGDAIGELESVKATSDLYCGVDGKIIAINRDLANAPELVNDDPYGRGWIAKIAVRDERSLDGLMSAEDYDRMTAAR